MKKKLAVIFSMGTIFALSLGCGLAYAEDKVQEKAQEKVEKDPEIKVIEGKELLDLTAEGKILKQDTKYVLKTADRAFIILPETKIKLDDFVGKVAKISGKGTITTYDVGGKKVDKQIYTTLENVTLVEAKEKVEAKPEEKKPEEKK